MNLRQTILSKLDLLSPQEATVAQWIVDHLQIIPDLSMKNICKKLNVQESVISKTLQKVGLEGFKNFKQLLNRSLYLASFENEEAFFNQWYENLNLDLKRTFEAINFDQLKNVVRKIVYEQKPIIIFATGKTKIIAHFFYFTLLEYGYDVKIYSSVYEPDAFKVENKLVFVITLSGNNSKISRYLNLINVHRPTNLDIVGISNNENFLNQEFIDYAFKANIHYHYSEDSRTNPIFEKYPVLIILDLLSFFILQNQSKENKNFASLIKSTNIIS